jgi:hypothetical protein
MVVQQSLFQDERLYQVQWKENEELGTDMLTGKWRGVSDKIVIKTTIRKMPIQEAKEFVEHLEIHVRYYQKWYKIIDA